MKKLLLAALLAYCSCAHKPALHEVVWADDSQDQKLWACVPLDDGKMGCFSFSSIFLLTLSRMSPDELERVILKAQQVPKKE